VNYIIDSYVMSVEILSCLIEQIIL